MKLKKISDSIFQEAEPKDRSRPLEWRRNFHFVEIPLKNVSIFTGCKIHEIDFKWKEETSVNPLQLVKSNISDNIGINGVLDKEKMRDSIYYAVEDEKKEGIFSIEKPTGITKITLKAGKPSEEAEEIRGGLYYGRVLHSSYGVGEDDLFFELHIPKDQMLSLIAAIRLDENATTLIGVWLLAFTYEVDDALREYDTPRDFVIDNVAFSFVSSVTVQSNIGNHFTQNESESESENENENAETHPFDKEKITQNQIPHQDLLQVLLSYSKPLKNLVTAVWALFAVIAMYAIFK